MHILNAMLKNTHPSFNFSPPALSTKKPPHRQSEVLNLDVRRAWLPSYFSVPYAMQHVEILLPKSETCITSPITAHSLREPTAALLPWICETQLWDSGDPH